MMQTTFVVSNIVSRNKLIYLTQYCSVYIGHMSCDTTEFSRIHRNIRFNKLGYEIFLY